VFFAIILKGSKTITGSYIMTVKDENRRRIIDIYMKNVHGNKPDTSSYTSDHDGREGHWLENKMGIAHNASNNPDLFDHEMKNATASKTSYGDWSADYYIFKDTGYETFRGKDNLAARDRFMEIFGHPSTNHEGKYSWSGKPIPKINQVNSFGQELIIDDANNVVIRYFFSKDIRDDKNVLIPSEFQKEGLVIARWDADSLKKKVENKFNQSGWFKCIKNREGAYELIVFGDPMDYDTWLQHVRNGDIFFDSGMHQGNVRPYSQWRASNSFWEKLVTDRYPDI